MTEPTKGAVTLLEALPRPVAQGGHLPFAFALTTALPREQAPAYRTAESEAYGARVFVCTPSNKPITRCFEITS